jgi:hypothetical protein
VQEGGAQGWTKGETLSLLTCKTGTVTTGRLVPAHRAFQGMTAVLVLIILSFAGQCQAHHNHLLAKPNIKVILTC